MKVSSKEGGVTRVRVERLRLRIPAGDARDARSLTRAVASRLAARAEDLAQHDGRDAVHVRVNAPASGSSEALADRVADVVAGPRPERGGGR